MYARRKSSKKSYYGQISIEYKKSKNTHHTVESKNVFRYISKQFQPAFMSITRKQNKESKSLDHLRAIRY